MKNNKVEYLSKDIFDEGFLDVYKYIHALEMLIGMCRVDARARFVTTPSTLQKLYTCISTVTRFVISTMAMTYYFQIFANYPALHRLCVSIMVLQSLINLANTVHVRFFNNDDNVRFYLEMQVVDRVMKITDNKTVNGIMRTVTNSTLGIVLGLWVALISVSAIEGQVLMGCVGIFLIFGPCIVEIIHLINILMYFLTRASFINAIISNSIKTSKKKVKLNYIFISRHFMRKLAACTHDFASSETDVYLKKLLSCFATFQKLYNFQVSR